MKWWTDIWPQIVANLKGHPEATLAVGMLLAGVGMYLLHVNPAFAFGLPVTIYVLYHLRMNRHGAHKERMAEIGVKKIEATRGLPAKGKATKAIERRRKTDAK
jgi:hypothetical protein